MMWVKVKTARYHSRHGVINGSVQTVPRGPADDLPSPIRKNASSAKVLVDRVPDLRGELTRAGFKTLLFPLEMASGRSLPLSFATGSRNISIVAVVARRRRVRSRSVCGPTVATSLHPTASPTTIASLGTDFKKNFMIFSPLIGSDVVFAKPLRGVAGILITKAV